MEKREMKSMLENEMENVFGGCIEYPNSDNLGFPTQKTLREELESILKIH